MKKLPEKPLSTETAFEFSATVNELVQKGKDIIKFQIGEPDFDTPKNVKRIGASAILDNKTHYSIPQGIPELRTAVAEHISNTRKIDVSPEEVLITPGAKTAILLSILATTDKDDEVICPNPAYPGYFANVDFFGAKTVYLPLYESENFRFKISDLEKKITDKTKMIVLNSPHNPTGGVLTKYDINEVAELAKKHDLWVLSDEIYSRIMFDGEHHSIASIPGMKERTLIIDGFSKIYAMTGWRLGYVIGDKELIQNTMTKLLINTNSCTATFTQHAGIEALTGPQTDCDKMVQEFKERRDLIVDGLNSITGVKCLKPQGTFYVFPNVTEACKKLGLKDSYEMRQYLLYYGGVAVLSRDSFGKKNPGENEEYIRLSFATSKENIRKGIERIRKAVTDEKMIRQYFKDRMH